MRGKSAHNTVLIGGPVRVLAFGGSILLNARPPPTSMPLLAPSTDAVAGEFVGDAWMDPFRRRDVPIAAGGIAKLRVGNAAGGNGDIAAAKGIHPGIADEFASYGIR